MYFITEEEDDLKITHELVPCDVFCQTARTLQEPTERGVIEGCEGSAWVTEEFHSFNRIPR